jgi:hypothetical protein
MAARTATPDGRERVLDSGEERERGTFALAARAVDRCR